MERYVPPSIRQRDVASKMAMPVVINSPSRWHFWRKPVVISMELLARQIDLADERRSLEQRETELVAEVINYGQRQRQTRKQEKKWRRLFRKIEWASQPAQRNKPRLIPGLGLEAALISGFFVIGIANLLM